MARTNAVAHGDGTNARSIAGRLFFAFFQWKKLVIWLCVGLCVRSLCYSVMNSHESHVEKHRGACQRCFVGRKPILGRFESHWEPFLTSKSLYRPFRRELEKVPSFRKLPFGLQSSVLSAFTTLQLLPQQELPASFGCLWCQRCIVVSNGYSIHGQCFGKMIASHHVIIIRLNGAPVKERKKDVSKRTSICRFFLESALPKPLENKDNVTLVVFVTFGPLDFLWLREILLKTRNKMKVGFWHQPPQEWNRNISQLRILNPYVTYKVMYKLLQLNMSSRRYATTGITALNLALHIHQEVNIAGSGYPGNHDNTTPIHYYNTESSLGTDAGTFRVPFSCPSLLFHHNTTTETNWLLKMIKSGVIADIASPSFQAQSC
ncbi:CMP-N-acetylneuraminate-beta-galactosamide-alpha-2,3-sialyltransferase 4-like [Nyctibius grandis]|uniref:CMP-N-acetylneuraminate-beta-galactosamide- alpha-2,3-sialyltransferase 4-like n=1 Tax=Nyctibius grandis TaxID=48427 RepID=UPI0035BBD52D